MNLRMERRESSSLVFSYRRITNNLIQRLRKGGSGGDWLLGGARVIPTADLLKIPLKVMNQGIFFQKHLVRSRILSSKKENIVVGR